MQAGNVIQENINKILELFPHVASEIIDANGDIQLGIDFNKLQQELSFSPVLRTETYGFSWVGKNNAIAAANSSTDKVLELQKNKSVNLENTNNMYIEGDNLEALKILQTDYSNKIKVIYIDPPYNTGKDFVYNDNFKINKSDYKKLNTSNLTVKYNKADASSARLHSAWCSMMYSRLKLAKKLLSDDGIIFISIDDKEIDNLKKICNEIFGETSFITSFIWEKTQHFGRQKLNAYSNVDYILCYAKSFSQNSIKELLVERINNGLFDAPLYNASNNMSTIIFPKGTVKFKIKDGIYKQSSSSKYILKQLVEVKNGVNNNDLVLSFKSRWSSTTVLNEIKKGTTFLVKTDSFAVRAVYPNDKTTNVAPRQIIFTNENNPQCTYSRFNDKVTTSETATKYLNNILDENIFSYPKPVSLIMYLCSLIYDYKNNKHDDNFTVLDFFSGSGTTAEAIMKLNAYDNGNRKFILVQVPEPLNNSKFCNICELGEERIRKVGTMINKRYPNQNIDTGFKVYTIK